MNKALAAVLTDEDRRDLVESHLEWVKGLASRMAGTMPHNIDLADLVQDGILGLIDVAERFDPLSGNKFTTFAERRVRGSMIDALRKDAWPRGIRQMRRKIEAARNQIRSETGEVADLNEIATKIGISLDDFVRWLTRISVIEATSPFTPADQVRADFLPVGALKPAKNPSPHEEYEQVENRELVTRLITSLPSRLQTVATLYYFEELTMKEIGERLGVHESRVSQLHARAIRKMREALDKNPTRPKKIYMRRRTDMRIVSRATNPSPAVVGSDQKLSEKTKGKVLVVEADYFCLTQRRDENVIFWGVGRAHVGCDIPRGVKYIWASQYVAEEVKRYFSSLPGIQYWDCGLFELRRRLLPVWNHHYNRSMMMPATDQQDGMTVVPELSGSWSDSDSSPGYKSGKIVGRIGTALGSVDFPRGISDREVEEDPETRGRADDDDDVEPDDKETKRKAGLKLLKAAVKRFQVKQKEQPKPVVASKTGSRGTAKLKKLKELLDTYATFEKDVFQTYYGVLQEGGNSGKGLSETAALFGMSEPNIAKKIIQRVWSRLAAAGFNRTEEWLHQVLNNKS